YAAGLVLYQMCTGRLPFTESGAMLIDAVLNKAIPAPRKLKKDITPELEAVILRALEKDPKHRYQSAREMLRDLEAISATGQRHISYWTSRVALVIAPISVLIALAMSLPDITKRFVGIQSQQMMSLAVLPLENLSHDPDQEYIADGITEGL